MEQLTIGEIGLRLGCAVAAGLVCGYERESHGRAAGLRTTLLVAIASAIAMVVSEQLSARAMVGGAAWRPDPARLAAGVLTGIGFLGAGVILRQENEVRGVTTAAVLWLVTILGLAFGSGQYVLGGLGFVVALAALFVLPAWEMCIKVERYGNVLIRIESSGPSTEEVRGAIEELGITVKGVKLDCDLTHRQRTVEFAVRFKRDEVWQLAPRVVEQLSGLPGVLEVKWS